MSAYHQPGTFFRRLNEFLGFVFCDTHKEAGSITNPVFAGCYKCWDTKGKGQLIMEDEKRAELIATETRRRASKLSTCVGLKEAILEAFQAVRIEQAELDACICERIWKEAANTKESGFRQNEISHGCTASAAAIRAAFKERK